MTDEPTNVTPFDLAYRGQSHYEADDDRVDLFTNANRGEVGFRGVVREPIPMREALATLYEIVKSDFRYVPKDRSAYLAWRAASQREGASRSAFEQQKAYFDWLRENDPHAWLILDPIVTAHPDKVMFEVFSKDEGTYARLDVDWAAFQLDGDPKLGTTNVDYSKELFDGVLQMRDGRETTMAMSADAFGLKTDTEEVLEKHIEVPNSWLHGFLQVQSAATLSDVSFELSPMDLYNVLRYLRLHADQKGKGRSIRAELTPGEVPRLVLEPLELVLEADAPVYDGPTAQVVKIWGRRRLSSIQRLLPFVEKVDVHLIGSGMPGFWVFHCGPIRLTMGLTGFVASNWSQAVHLDVMLPATAENDAYDKVVARLKKDWSVTAEDLAADLKADARNVLSALQRACRKGLAIYDIASQTYRYRPVADDPIDDETITFRNPREREAHDLLDGHGGGVKLTSEIEVVGRGMEYHAQVDVEADQREYEVSFQLTPDGRLYRPDCSCTFFRQHAMKEGPCPHLYALRLLVARRELEARDKRGTDAITAETRTYVRRHDDGEDVYTLTLDKEQVRVRWGLRAETSRRFQRFMFNGVDAARAAYLERIGDLEAKGFLDATE
jgi:hypothetical protein